jgi:hypothetical protein
LVAVDGPVTHRYMIDNAPDGVVLDEAYLATMLVRTDEGMYTYWKRYFQIKLAEENARRAMQGLGPLREAPAAGQIEGRLITF